MLKYLAISMTLVVGTLLLLVIGILLFLWLAPVFGGKPDTVSQEKIAASNHFTGSIFRNRIPTEISTRTEQSPSTWDLIKSLLSPPANKNPQQPLPSKVLDKVTLKNGDMVWLGHSTVIFKTEDITVITDPVFYRASPVPMGGDPFKFTSPIPISKLPVLDVVIISHDHYDHLDMRTIREINSKVKQFLVPLGVKAHLQRWGVDNNKIIELDWYQSSSYAGVEFILAPSRHFSGRGFSDRNKTLWGSWVVKAPELSLYFSGDGGYSPDFKDIGDKYGPFDIALMENGAYDRDWAQIHMFPEETAKAVVDLRAARVLPVHWGKFDLAQHNWRDPIERLTIAAKALKVELATPFVGEVFRLDSAPQHQWWNEGAGANE
jgi:L-ascorbate metabolism protein UlaG (beta-lactamase superfamily)